MIFHYTGRTPDHYLKNNPDCSHYIEDLKILDYIKGKINVIVEIGGYDCSDSIILHKTFQPQTYIVAEASPENWNMCEQKLLDAGLNKNIKLYKKAILDIDYQQIKLYAFPDNDAAGSIFEHINLPTELVFQVETITLDTMCDIENITKIDLLCIDAQGAELKIITGAKNIISQTKYLVIEAPIDKGLYLNQPCVNEYNQILQENNFKLLKQCNIGHYTDSLYENILLCN